MSNNVAPFLQACQGRVTQNTPIWIMRQAGRILKPYRDLRQEHGSILKLFTTPELAAEITLMPIEMLGVDAAILFTDLVTPLEPLVGGLSYDPGPVFADPIRSATQIDTLRTITPEEDLKYVLDTAQLVRQALPPTVPLIGYAGGPFTLATWIVEGSSSKDFPAFRRMIHGDPILAHKLLDKLSDLVINFLRAQIAAGAQAVQIFDTSIGLLSPEQFAEFALPYLKRICHSLAPLDTPVIYFPLAAAQSLTYFGQVGAQVLGLDWRIDLTQARAQFGDAITLQGNLDPCILYGSEDSIVTATQGILEKTKGRPHIFNLGHGVFPDTPYEKVKLLVETVQKFAN